MRPTPLVLLLLALLALAGCGGSDTLDQAEEDVRAARERLEERVRERVDRAQAEYEERRERFGRRIEEVLAQLEQAVPEAQETSPTVRSRGRNQPQTIDAFLTDVLTDIDAYWTRTLEAANLPTPQVRYSWVPPGRTQMSGCGQPANDRAAFYCPADDTIYVAQAFASDLYRGVAEGLPGQQTGVGRAAGDFAVAYVLAHEYGHNLQQELGVFDNRETPTAKPFELQADCLAGTWANSVYEQGLLEPGDLEEATNAALAVGDFDVGNAQHHGRPEERRAALLTGYRTGEPAACERYLPGGGT